MLADREVRALMRWSRRPVRGDGLPAEVDGECVFCRIVDGRSPASVVAGDDRALAFLDRQPLTTGHLLVVPRAHATDLAGLDDADGQAVWALGVRLTRAVREAGLAEGVNLLLADGAVAFQTIWHVHLHVLPRQRGDGLALSADWTRPSQTELDATAARVRAAFPVT